MNNTFIATAFKEMGDADREIFALMNANRQLQAQIAENERLISIQMQRKHIIENSVGAQIQNFMSGSNPRTISVQPQTVYSYADNGYTTVNEVPMPVRQTGYSVAPNTANAVPVPTVQAVQPQPMAVPQPVSSGVSPVPQPVSARCTATAPRISRQNLLSVCRRGLQAGKNVHIDNILASHGYKTVGEVPDSEISVIYNELVRVV